MGFYGRHRAYAIFWTWAMGPIVVNQDISQLSGSKSTGGTQRCSIGIHPRGLAREIGQRLIGRERGYMDVLRSNDWVFVFCDPFDGQPPEPLFMGFIDDVRMAITLDQSGARTSIVQVSCSGWEKAFDTISCISDAWVSRYVNIATLYDIAMRGVGEDNEFVPSTTNAIVNIIRVFLMADGTERAAAERAQTDGILQSELVREEYQYLSRQAELQDLVGSSEPVPIGSSISAIMAQYQLPRTNRSLWDLLKLRFEDLREYTFNTPQGMVNMLGQPLSKFISEWSNPMMNQIIYDVRRFTADGLGHLRDSGQRSLDEDAIGGYTSDAFAEVISAAGEVSSSVGALFNDIAPHMILMKRPLFPFELMELDGPTIDSDECTDIQLGFSDSDHYNVAWFECASLSSQQLRLSSGVSGFDYNSEQAIEMIRRHGLRIYQETTNSWPDTRSADDGGPPPFPVYSEEFHRPWSVRLQRAGLDQIELLTGNLTLPKFVRGLFLGGKVVLNLKAHPGLFARGTQRVFFVDSYDFQYSPDTGMFVTDIGVTRGYPVEAAGHHSAPLTER